MVLDKALPMKVKGVVPTFAEENEKRRDSGEGDALLAALDEEIEKLRAESERPRESWSSAALREENEKLAAEIARMKEEAALMKEGAYKWEAQFRMYAPMGGPWTTSWGYPGDVSPLSDFMPQTMSSNAYNSATFAGPTSMMMRNIPNNYTRAKVLDLLDKEGFGGTFDFFYLPIDLKKKFGLGYAFINFVDHGIAAAFRQHFDGFSNWVATSGKVCQVTFSDRIQGLEAHVERYRNSAIMHPSVPEEFKPMIFQNGTPMPFSPPTKPVPAPQER